MPKRKDEPDFKKVKHRVGTKKVDPKATNVNIRTKRIRIQEQSILREEQDIVNSHNKSLSDLVGQFTHFNANNRKEAVLGLKDLFMSNEVLYSSSINILITKTIPLLLDNDVAVRQAVVSVFEVLLPNVPKSSLLPFSGVICVFVNNALTSINPSIRKSALLMMQVLLKIAPELFEDQKMKILASLIKLTTEVKVMNTPVRGVLSTNRNTMKTNTSQQRPLSDLALETIQLFFETSFGQTSIYHRIDDWSGFSHARSAEPLLLSPSRRLCIPLSRSLYSPSLFLHTETTKPVDALETTTAAFQPLLAFLHAGMAELLPHDDAALGGHLSRHLTDSRSKSIDERSLQRLLPLQELAASLLALLRGQLGKARAEWLRLLQDFYPLRVADAQRNEAEARKLLLQVNTLTLLLSAMLGGEQAWRMVEEHLRQKMVMGKGEAVGTETVVLEMELLHLLCERERGARQNVDRVLEMVDRRWEELLDHQLGILSLPFVQFYNYAISAQLVSSFERCLQLVMRCLKDVPFSDTPGSKSNVLWKAGLRLVLSIVKMVPTVDSTIQEAFVELSKPASLVPLLNPISIVCGLPLDQPTPCN